MADVTGGQYRLQVQPGVLIQASQELHAIADELNVAHRRLVGEVEQLLGSSWQGQASGAFGKDWQEFEKGSRGVIEDARAIAEFVDYCTREYIQQESINAERVQSIHPQAPRDL
jgi:WXG100 family type VII secretion target